jgi:hypothetical protein
MSNKSKITLSNQIKYDSVGETIDLIKSRCLPSTLLKHYNLYNPSGNKHKCPFCNAKSVQIDDKKGMITCNNINCDLGSVDVIGWIAHYKSINATNQSGLIEALKILSEIGSVDIKDLTNSITKIDYQTALKYQAFLRIYKGYHLLDWVQLGRLLEMDKDYVRKCVKYTPDDDNYQISMDKYLLFYTLIETYNSSILNESKKIIENLHIQNNQ